MKSLILRLSQRTYLVLLIAVALVMRVFLMLKADVWHDEAFTMNMIQYHGFTDIIERTMRDVHPPFYYLITHAWSLIFGSSVLSIRGFSVVCGVLTAIVFYLLMRKLFPEFTARIAGLFVAIGPFAARYSDEARMYALVALLVTCATFALVVALEKSTDRTRWWMGYGLCIVAALYTQYYALFILPAHIGYTWWKLGGFRTLIRHRAWWLTHLGIVLLFLPWLPILKDQVSRVTSGFWIPPATPETVPHTISQFLVYASSSQYFLLELVTLHIVILTVLYLVIVQPKMRAPLLLLSAWVAVPIIAVLILSLKQPVYQDRYFTYSSIAFYGILGVIVTLPFHAKKSVYRNIAIIATTLILVSGFIGVSAQAVHRMGSVGDYVSRHARSGDTIISAELYTYFDFNYYNRSGLKTYLLYHDPVTGYGETSLLYDKPDIFVKSLSDIKTQRIWVVGKTGDHDYYTTQVPSDWHLVTRVQAGDSAVQLYTKQ